MAKETAWRTESNLSPAVSWEINRVAISVQPRNVWLALNFQGCQQLSVRGCTVPEGFDKLFDAIKFARLVFHKNVAPSSVFKRDQ